jgi:hypothetical protein
MSSKGAMFMHAQMKINPQSANIQGGRREPIITTTNSIFK